MVRNLEEVYNMVRIWKRSTIWSESGRGLQYGPNMEEVYNMVQTQNRSEILVPGVNILADGHTREVCNTVKTSEQNKNILACQNLVNPCTCSCQFTSTLARILVNPCTCSCQFTSTLARILVNPFTCSCQFTSTLARILVNPCTCSCQFTSTLARILVNPCTCSCQFTSTLARILVNPCTCSCQLTSASRRSSCSFSLILQSHAKVLSQYRPGTERRPPGHHLFLGHRSVAAEVLARS